jgi:KaiC/GvpD/RAD55 family RecA-like ATPase
MQKCPVLRFGIQSFDRLIGTVTSYPEDPLYGIDVSEPEISTTGEETENVLPITSSVCLAGPDGTGKSIISLHLASQYLADSLEDGVTGSTHPNLKVLYISTDLTYKMALKGWYHFGLDQPFKRREPLVELKEGRTKKTGRQFEIALRQYFPASAGSSKQSITQYLEGYSSECGKPEVCFVDLASRTAGDDWGFVHRLLSTLNEPSEKDPRHLVILDAVEGFETLVGDLNAFGEESSRRSRIAQVMRLAGGRCHLLLVVEESHHQRFPEEFVTDVVIRLRNLQTGRYVRRTVEIEKARGQWHRRGQHPYVIRNGIGSTTGEQQNADDPEVFRDEPNKKHQGYVHIFPSLDYTSREIMIERNDPVRIPDKTRFAAFGLPYLDNMLGGKGEKAEKDAEGQFDTRGLPCSSATALIGDSLTQKSQLGKAFLSRAFYAFAEDLRKEIAREGAGTAGASLVNHVEDGIRDIAHNKTTIAALTASILAKITQHVERLADQLSNNPDNMYPVAVLFTTQDLSVEALSAEFYQWLRHEDTLALEHSANQTIKDRIERVENNIQNFVRWYEHLLERRAKRNKEPEPTRGSHYRRWQNELEREMLEIAIEKVMRKHMEARTICRRFEIHDLAGPVLMNVFQCGIEKAQKIMFGGAANKALPKGGERFQESWRIRVVVDDLNSFRNTYPDIREDPLMLPSLLFMFGREGVTSLIVDTQPSGSPELSITERFDSSVRELVQTRIYIWRLPFYGENRVAISVIPPMSHEFRGLIRELRWETKNETRPDRALSVDPHFELYAGLDRAAPQPVPLEVRLYSDIPSVARYIATEERLLGEIFTPVLKHDQQRSVIIPAQLHEYEPLRDACHVQRDTRLDHTTIVQVNEFWWLRRPRQRRAGAFRPQWNYLSSATARLRGDKYYSDPVVDPFWVFQPTPLEEKTAARHARNTPDETSVKRKHEFYDKDCEYGYESLNEEEKQYVDRVPYTWDFGFLLCNGRAWEEAHHLLVNKSDSEEREKTVADVWANLCKANGGGSSQAVSWREFLAASKIVAEFQSYRTSTRSAAFDFTMLIPESFSCLMLEMWFSETFDSLREYAGRNDKLKESFEKKRERLKGVSHRRWSSTMEYPVTLLTGLRNEKTQSLKDILKLRREGTINGFSLELYKVWLLLTEAVNFAELLDSSSHLNFEFKSRDIFPNTVSARHWYKSASSFMDSLTPEQVEHNWIPVRLPGHFSVRGDWFLAVTGGSRSSRLADHALDLLSSQRANVTRLQEGIGLPTRRLFSEAGEGSGLRTRLISAEKGRALKNIEYDTLRKIGAQKDDQEFFWLWRSGIGAYNRHSRIWHKWLNRALLWWHSKRQRHGSNWTNGFEAYDLLTTIEFGPEKVRAESVKKFDDLGLDSWQKFDELRDILISELEQVSISTI